MSEYLSKEEIKQWRSSLEKITLEEYAARLGKKIEETKPTNDLIDIVLKGKPVVSNTEEYKQTRTERLSSIAERAYEREREIAPSPFTINKILTHETPVKIEKTEKKTVSSKKATPKSIKKETAAVSAETLRDEVRIVFKKALTDREQKVFDHFVEHKNKIVYAKDLASLLDLPRDYVYKYIKNLRAKIEGENLKNADKGGFILNI
ncbi:TPA: helix-turn-helix domain-containing protein [Candidatus Gastranaerophilales bacterium HUM_20]|nr:unknown [Clostridium sp. CAG:729]DAB24630.1 MAG TPA: helix-turn-helix domain-containing protein [Candidatus Gastranaerophilales bacterium HUM_20]